MASHATRLVQLIRGKVEQNPRYYHIFITALQEDQTQYGDILQKLQYTIKIRQEETSASLSTVSNPSPSTGTYTADTSYDCGTCGIKSALGGIQFACLAV